ncbi:MAG: hypothetical protein AAFP77_00090 [Bacteroidota bacterium]
MFVGNIPTGSKFYGKAMAVGVYWENAWGARDLDLSGLNIAFEQGGNRSAVRHVMISSVFAIIAMGIWRTIMKVSIA